MEALFYDHTISSAAIRQAHICHALHAFLADSASRSAVHLIALFVHIPTPSTLSAAAQSPSSSNGRISGSIPAPHTGRAVMARGTSTRTVNSVASSSPAVSRRSRSAQKLAWCAWEADRRLRQAAEDAAAINIALAQGTLPARSTDGAARAEPFTRALVVPVAFLAPQVRDDLTVYESWQRCAEVCTEAPAAAAVRGAASRTTRTASPLRHASLIALSLGSPSLLLSWAERPARCYLDNLLLPHQSLLMDLTWWLGAAGESACATDALATGKRVSNSVLRDIFLSDVQPSFKLPKGDSRCVVWISYVSLLALLHPQATAEIGNSISGGGVGMSGCTGRGTSGRRCGWNARSGNLFGVNEDAFMTTYVLIRRLVSSLNASQSGAMGRTQLLRVVLSFGGSSSSLRRRLVHTCCTTAHGKVEADAALLSTRSLVDVHALFAVLSGQDTVNVYGEAAAFVRTARRRASAGHIWQQYHRQIALNSARVQVTLPPRSSDPISTELKSRACSDSGALRSEFVDRGVRALAGKMRSLARKRLGKRCTRVVRARSRAKTSKGALKRLRANTSDADSERVLESAVERARRAAVSHIAGKKRYAEPLETGVDRTSAGTTKVSSPPQKQRKADVKLVCSKPTADTALSWCEDMSGDRPV